MKKIKYIFFCIIILFAGCESDYQSKKIHDLSQNYKFTIYPIYNEGDMFHFKIEGYSNYNFKLKYYFFGSDLEKPYMTDIKDFKNGEIKYKMNRDFYFSEGKGKVIIEFIPSSNLTKGELTLSGKI